MSGTEGAGSERGSKRPKLFTNFASPLLVRDDIPRDITHARISPSVKSIGVAAFKDCEQLIEVDLSEGLEHIGDGSQLDEGAFQNCKSLRHMKVPFTVKKIGTCAFKGCEKLFDVVLCEGLEKLDLQAFHGCKALHCQLSWCERIFALL